MKMKIVADLQICIIPLKLLSFLTEGMFSEFVMSHPVYAENFLITLIMWVSL